MAEYYNVNFANINGDINAIGEVFNMLLVPQVTLTSEEFIYLFSTNAKEDSDEEATYYLRMLAECGMPLKVFITEQEPGSYREDEYMLEFILKSKTYLPHWTDEGDIRQRLQIIFSCVAEGITWNVILEEQLDTNYTLEFVIDNIDAHSGNTSVDIGMVEYTSLFALGGTLTAEDIGTVMFDRLNIAITNNTPFYVNKWKTISETEKYVEPLKFERYQTMYDLETNEPIRHSFACTYTNIVDNKIAVVALTLVYDVVNQTITGGQAISE